jgi:hypothetical protein
MSTIFILLLNNTNQSNYGQKSLTHQLQSRTDSCFLIAVPLQGGFNQNNASKNSRKHWQTLALKQQTLVTARGDGYG